MHENVEYAFGGTRPMLALIEGIYSAVLNPELWDETLGRISSHLGGDSIALFAGAPNAQTPHLLSLYGMDPGAWGQFAAYYANINPIMAQCEQRLSPGQTWFAHAVLTDAQLENTEFYCDFFQRFDMHHSVGLRLATPQLPVANLSCQRRKAAGAFDTPADTVLQTLRPHLLQALTLRSHLGAMHAQRLGLEAAIDAYDHAVIGIDGRGCVMLCSSGAQELLRSNCGLVLTGGRLACNDRASDSRLQAFLRAALSLRAAPPTTLTRTSGSLSKRAPRAASLEARPTSAGSSMMLWSQRLQRQLCLTVLPHRLELRGHAASLAALVFLSDEHQKSRPRANTLIALYALTPTEARIADLLASGARHRGRCHATRAHPRNRPLLHQAHPRQDWHAPTIRPSSPDPRPPRLARVTLLPCNSPPGWEMASRSGGGRLTSIHTWSLEVLMLTKNFRSSPIPPLLALLLLILLFATVLVPGRLHAPARTSGPGTSRLRWGPAAHPGRRPLSTGRAGELGTVGWAAGPNPGYPPPRAAPRKV